MLQQLPLPDPAAHLQVSCTYLYDQFDSVSRVFCIRNTTGKPTSGKDPLEICLYFFQGVGKIGPGGQRVISNALQVFTDSNYLNLA